MESRVPPGPTWPSGSRGGGTRSWAASGRAPRGDPAAGRSRCCPPASGRDSFGIQGRAALVGMSHTGASLLGRRSHPHPSGLRCSRLDGAWSKQVQREAPPSRGWSWMRCKVPSSQPIPWFCDASVPVSPIPGQEPTTSPCPELPHPSCTHGGAREQTRKRFPKQCQESGMILPKY